MDYVTVSLSRLTALIGFIVMLVACGGAPGNNSNISTPSPGGETEVDDGVINIQFVSASNTQVFLRGQGGIETSIVTFKTTNSSGNPLPNVAVSFQLNTSLGGVRLLGDVQGVRTDSSGNASITISSGTVPTPARVTAVIDGSEVSAISDDITISTGVPVANKFSIAANPDWFVDEARDKIGVTTTISVLATDQAGNPAFDGIGVSFWSPETGAITASCVLNNGGCSAEWRSSGSMGASDLFSRVFAFTEGAEAFVDLNGNSIFDAGETFTDLGEPFVDTNESGTYDLSEPFVDIDGNGVWDMTGNGLYDGPCLGENPECSGEDTVISLQGSLYLCSMTEGANDGFEALCGFSE